MPIAIGSWWLAAWVGQPLRYTVFAAVLALCVAEGTMRVHLLFVERQTPRDVPRQLAASGGVANLEIDLAATGNYTFLLDTRSGLDTPTLLVMVYEAAEPGTLALLGLGLAGLGLSRRRIA